MGAIAEAAGVTVQTLHFTRFVLASALELASLRSLPRLRR
jgi:hypothetical protein